MSDLTPLLNELLKSHDAPPVTLPSFTVQNLNSFLKEAYTIVRATEMNENLPTNLTT